MVEPDKLMNDNSLLNKFPNLPEPAPEPVITSSYPGEDIDILDKDIEQVEKNND